jgi:hypothetical protein
VSSDCEASWVDTYLKPRYPELVPLYTEACSIASEARASGRLTAPRARRLIELASSARTPLGENVAGMLGELAAAMPEAQDAIAALAEARQVHGRINALVAIESFPVGPRHHRLIGMLLRDRSRRVRGLAADKAVSFGLKELLPELNQAVEAETNPELRDELEGQVALLRDGYRVRARDDGSMWVTCRKGRGVVSRFFSLGQFESEGRRWIAEQLK